VSEELASVELTVTTAALVRTIGRLAVHFPEKFHLEAWRVFSAELANREIGLPVRPIVLAQRHYDDLPSDVKAALRGITPT
jgi:hypothetical protein